MKITDKMISDIISCLLLIKDKDIKEFLKQKGYSVDGEENDMIEKINKRFSSDQVWDALEECVDKVNEMIDDYNQFKEDFINSKMEQKDD